MLLHARGAKADPWELQSVDAYFLQHTWIKWVANADEGTLAGLQDSSSWGLLLATPAQQ